MTLALSGRVVVAELLELLDLDGRSAHELVELRATLAGRIEAIDARLRELDGRNTAGAASLNAERCGCGLSRRHEGPCDR